MKIALVSDAWAPQVNGVVRTLETTAGRLAARGHQIATITPDGFRTWPCPTYPEIRLALGCAREVGRRLSALDPDAIHIATEGPLGWAARRWSRAEGRSFSTSFHTRFPDYAAVRTGLPAGLFWPVMQRFHASASAVMVATPTLAEELYGRGITRTHRWSRGVDLDLFNPHAPCFAEMARLPRPIQLYVGRVAVEKNIAAFLDVPTKGTKVVVGDGPARGELQSRYRQARFLGALHGPALAAAYASADVFVFPSLTDTFGLVMIEALAAGTPVAAFPVPGPIDVLGPTARDAQGAPIGALDHDLRSAIERALGLNRAACAGFARRYSWDACTDQFLDGLSVRPRPMRLAA